MDLVSVNKRRLNFQLASSPQSVTPSDKLSVSNLAPHPVAFKVKTNNQDRYIVRPNVGVIDIDALVNITISFHPNAPIPDVNIPSKDKFLLRVAPILPNQRASLSEFWSQSESDPAVRGLKFHVDFTDSSVPTSPSGLIPDSPTFDSAHDATSTMVSNMKSAVGSAGSTAATVPAQLSSVMNDFIASSQHAKNTYSPSSPDTVMDTTNTDTDMKTTTTPSVPTIPPSSSISSPPVQPHTRDLPPDLLPAPASSLSATPATAGAPLTSSHPLSATTLQQSQQQQPKESEEAREAQYQQAMARVAQLQTMLDERNLELSRLKTELAETMAETDRVLKDAPTTPLPANSLLSDPFGGVSVTGLGLMLLLFLLVVNIILRF